MDTRGRQAGRVGGAPRGVPRGAFCAHPRMRYRACEHCAPRPCAVECRDCGLGWMLYEDTLGYYYCGSK